jgi:hypothetical protein
MRHRVIAFLIHFAASAALVLLTLVLVFFVWYPAPLHKSVGVTQLFLVLLGVDVVIGPLLTFFVFKPGKQSLRFDLTTIVCLQLVAFSYGLWTVAEGRPAWLVFNADRFDLVQVYQLDSRKLDQAQFEYQYPSWFGPQWVAARLPDDAEERKSILFETLTTGMDIAQRPIYYRPLSDEADSIRAKARPLLELSKFNRPDEVAVVTARWPAADAFLPMMSKVYPVTVLINKESARVVAVVDLHPWE